MWPLLLSSSVFLSIFSRLAALMSANIAGNFDHISVAILTVGVYFIYFYFRLCFKQAAFCIELSLLIPFLFDHL